MSTPADMAERHGKILTELSELGLALARDLQARALAADGVEAAANLGLAFHRVSRSVRQSLALEVRLVRERAAAEREIADFAARETRARVQRRKDQVRVAVARAIWDEAEGEEAEELLDALEGRLDEEILDDAFTADPIETRIARLRADFGLPASRDDAANDAALDENSGGVPYEYDAAPDETTDGVPAPPPIQADDDRETVVHRVPAWAKAPAPPDRRSSA